MLVTTLFYDSEEARILLLGRSKKTSHEPMSADELIIRLNGILKAKSKKVKMYNPHDQFFLVIISASAIFGKATFDNFDRDIVVPKNKYKEIWLFSPEQDGELKRLK